MAEALLRADRLRGRADYRDVTRRVLASFGSVARVLLVEDQDATAPVADAVHYLRAYAQVVERPQGAAPRR
jgi:hypothetical protein